MYTSHVLAQTWPMNDLFDVESAVYRVVRKMAANRERFGLDCQLKKGDDVTGPPFNTSSQRK
jgi:hypothetical protein